MNAEPTPYEPVSPDERWIDAALSEHARLGRDGADEELVLRILRETVHRPAPVRFRPAGASFDRRTALAGVAAVAALVALLLAALRSLPVDPEPRRADGLLFVVRFPEAAPHPAEAPASPPLLAASRHQVPGSLVVPAAPASASPALVQVDLEVLPGFAPSFSSLPRKGDRRESMRISADRGEAATDALLYEGEVLVEHERFRIEADRVRVPLPDEAGGSAGHPILASRVRLVQESPRRVAEADTLSFDPVGGLLVLTGVKHFESERGSLARFAPGDRLILAGDGFTVESAPIEVHADVPPLRP